MKFHPRETRLQVRRMLREYGQCVLLRRKTPGTYTPADGDGGTPTPRNYHGLARIGRYRNAPTAPGDVTTQRTRLATYQPEDWTESGAAPAVGDELVAEDSTVYPIISVQVRELNGAALSYTLELRV